MFLVILVNALFSVIFPIGKIAMQYAPPFFIIGLRFILGGLFLLGFSYLFRPKSWRLPWGFWSIIILLALSNIYLANAYEFWGLQYMSSAKTAFIYNLSPFFSALFAYLHFSEKMSRNKWIGLLISTIGFIPIFLWESPEERQLCSFGFISSAELALLIATVATVYGWIILQYIIKQKGYDSVMSNGLSMVIGGLISLGHSRIVESWQFLNATSLLALTPWLLLIVFLSNIGAFSLLGYLLKYYSATFLSFSGLMGPLFAAFFDWIAFGVTVPWIFYVSTVLVAIGIYIFYKEEINLVDLTQ